MYWPRRWLLRPKLKLFRLMGGTDSQSDGPELMIPRVPTPVTKPRLESDTFGSVGAPVTPALRVKSMRASLTMVGLSVIVLASTNCCARVLLLVLKLP